MSTQAGTLQLGSHSNDDAFSISINPSEVVDDAAGSNSTKYLRRWLFASGLVTMVMGAAAAFYRPPRGVFEHHRFAYYATLVGIFAAGLAEVAGAAFCLSSSGERGRARSRAFVATVFCFSASVVPLAAVIALGGFAVVMKG